MWVYAERVGAKVLGSSIRALVYIVKVGDWIEMQRSHY